MPVKTSLTHSKHRAGDKLSPKKSSDSQNGVKDADSRRKGMRGNKELPCGGSGGIDVGRGKLRTVKRGTRSRDKDNGEESNAYRNDGFTPSIGKRISKLRIRSERKEVLEDGVEGIQLGTSNKKRRRVYADQSMENAETSNGSNGKRNTIRGKKTLKGESQASLKFGVKSALAGRNKSEASESIDSKKSRTLSKLKGKDSIENAETDDILGKGSRGVSTRKHFDQDQGKKGADIVKRTTKKKVQVKKSTTDDAEETEPQPKKKKRIRIDPFDTSNKRLDDGSVTKDGEEKKKDLSTTSNELSKNAQFRAIQPSPSILSFVEDNLLGRRREIEIKRAGYNIELSSPLDNIPLSTSSERERIEEPAFRNKLSFFAAAKVSSSFPPPDLPEIAFAGRSNVGKSSLLNSLTRQWGVVRTSDKPGLTQTINFFKLGTKLCLVDLPGYGFAYAKEEVKEAWEELVKEYVTTRVGLKRVCLLVDTKWGMKPRDYELVDLMERSKTKYQVVLTKTDLVFPIDVARRAMQIEESLKQHKSAVQPVMMVSSKSGAGIRSLRAALSKVARFIKP